ncbi:MAG: hypothetical protein M3Z26_16795 [Bacteroidota bacterium]|nr:hypothetical protein [Bacteroidota bacterium]
MKKLLLVFTVCAFFVACNSGSTSSTDATKDTTNTTVTHDSAMTPATTAPSSMDTSNKMSMDTTHKMSMDSVHH